MVSTRVTRGTTRTTRVTVTADETLIVERDAALRVNESAAAVQVTGGDAVLRNAGIIRNINGQAINGIFADVLDLAITNTSSGRIESRVSAVNLSAPAGTTGSVVFRNAGEIVGGSAVAVAMQGLNASTIAFTNLPGALVTNAGASDVLRPGNDATATIRVDNAGTIRAGVVQGATSNGDGVDLQSRDGGLAATIVNRATGVIEGGKHGVTGANGATITNLAGGAIIGRNGSGLNFDTELVDGDGVVSVRNYGLISGRYDGYGDGDGDGVDVDYLVDVRNFGRIEGVGADNVDDFADGIAAGGGVIRNYDGGVIFGAQNGILIDDGDRNRAYAATSIENDGLISASDGFAIRLIGTFDDRIVNDGTIRTSAAVAIDAGDGNDVVLNTGTIIGDVDLGAGDDRFVLHGDATVDGVVHGGAGDDRMIASGSAGVRFDGGAGRDVMVAGAGDDVFFFGAASDASPIASQGDYIRGFASGDLVDLTGIDANVATEADDAFVLIGDAAFTNVAGQLRLVAVDGNLVAFGDNDGDAVADFQIVFQDQLDPAVIAFNL